MSAIPTSSASSVDYRLIRQASRLPVGISALAGLFLTFSLTGSALRTAATGWQLVAAGLTLAALWCLHSRLVRVTRLELEWGTAGPIILDGESFKSLQTEWRGPLCFVVFSAGDAVATRVVAFVDAEERREFKLAVMRRDASQAREAVAP